MVSENQLKGLRILQKDTSKYLDQFTKLTSESTEAPVKSVSKPAPFSDNADQDFSLRLDHIKDIASLHHWAKDVCSTLVCCMLLYVTPKISMWMFVIILMQQFLLSKGDLTTQPFTLQYILNYITFKRLK